MAATYANSLLVESGEALLSEARLELSVQAVLVRAADVFVGLEADTTRASGDDTPADVVVIDDVTDVDDGDQFKLEGVSVTMARVSAAGGFVNQAVLPQFSRGLIGGPGFRTIVQEVADGGEVRISKWQRPKRQFDIGSAIDTPNDFRKLLAHYRQVRGALNGFRMRDPFDWSTHTNHVTKPDVSDASHRQLIGAGDGVTTSFQLCKRYRVGDLTRVRPITHPQFRGSENDTSGLDPADYVNEIFVDGTQQTVGTDYSWVWDGGQVDFVTAPAAGTAIYWCGTFEVPVRFDQSLDQGMLAEMRTTDSFNIALTATELSVPEPFSDHKWTGGVYEIDVSQNTAIDLGRGRFWNVNPTGTGLRLYLPSTKHLLDGGIIATIRNAGSNAIDVYNYELNSTKLTTLAASEFVHLLLCRDGTIRGIQ